MKQTSINMSCFQALCFLSLVLMSQAQTPLVLCPATAVEKRNIMVETPVTLPPAMNYQYSSPALFGTNVYEMTARVEGQKVFLSILKSDWKVYEQSKTYATPVQIAVVRSHHVIVKIFSADKSSFTYEVIKYDFSINTVGESPVNTGNVKALTGVPVGSEIKKVVYYAHEDNQLYLEISNGSQGNMYELITTTGVTSKMANFNAPVVPNFMGSGYFFWEATTSKFYYPVPEAVSEQTVTNGLTAANAVWYPATTKGLTILFHYSAYLSTDAASKKGTFIFHGPTFEVLSLGGGAVLPRIYSDNLLSVIAYSEKQLYWFSLNSVGALARTNNFRVYKKVGEGIDTAIADFSSALGVSTNSQTAFLLTATGLKFYKIETVSGAATVTKVGETLLPETVSGSFGTPGKLIAVSIKCQCASDAAPKLICFSSTLNCLMVTTKAFTDCTVTA